MVEYPFTKANRLQLAHAFHQVEHVDLSIDCVIEGQMGHAFVDQIESPLVYKIQTGPFVYMAGEPACPQGQEMLDSIPQGMLLMPSSPGWLQAALAFYKEGLRPFDRYRFSAAQLSLEHLQTCRASTPFDQLIQRMQLPLAQEFWGQEHFIDLSDYDSPADFIQRGIGYTFSQQNNVVGAAYASLVCSRGIEVSIFVEDNYRRQGLATALASHLLGWCLEHNLEPHWDAANPESCSLAMKLGYKALGSYEAHYLWTK